jgi:peroxin-3
MFDLEQANAQEEVGSLSNELEGKYLSLSWWILHVGWKDVGERVRRGVEEVFDGWVCISSRRTCSYVVVRCSVSLKSKLGAIDLHRLVNDVRRRVEYEITFEGTERRIKYVSRISFFSRTNLPPQ